MDAFIYQQVLNFIDTAMQQENFGVFHVAIRNMFTDVQAMPISI